MISVVDASIAVKWVIPEVLSDKADRVRDGRRRRPRPGSPARRSGQCPLAEDGGQGDLPPRGRRRLRAHHTTAGSTCGPQGHSCRGRSTSPGAWIIRSTTVYISPWRSASTRPWSPPIIASSTGSPPGSSGCPSSISAPSDSTRDRSRRTGLGQVRRTRNSLTAAGPRGGHRDRSWSFSRLCYPPQGLGWCSDLVSTLRTANADKIAGTKNAGEGTRERSRSVRDRGIATKAPGPPPKQAQNRGAPRLSRGAPSAGGLRGPFEAPHLQ